MRIITKAVVIKLNAIKKQTITKEKNQRIVNTVRSRRNYTLTYL